MTFIYVEEADAMVDSDDLGGGMKILRLIFTKHEPFIAVRMK